MASKLKRHRQSSSTPRPARATSSTVDYVQRFANYLRGECHLAENTIAAYVRDLRRLLAWLDGRPIRALRLDDLSQYVASLQREGLAPPSISRIIVSTRQFFKFLQLEGVIQDDPAELLATQRMWHRIPKAITARDVERFLEAPPACHPLRLRDRAIVEVLYATGCRVSEVCDLLIANLHLEEGYCQVEGKGGKQRIVPLGRRAVDAIRDYLRLLRPKLVRRCADEVPWVFVSRNGKRLRREAVWELVKKCALRSGIDPDVSPHWLRHSFATHMLAGGADLRQIQELLGHASIQTTQVYTQVDSSRIKKIHRQFHPRA
ncbi:MAG: site-specific tyrosine recombinase XerD [Planctomycetota bacterium]|nr:MAG: site-specific tyrosine recombinase XerD [Planctomycetota bacterium]